jgi:hypothetical protein
MRKPILFWLLLAPVLSYSQIQVRPNDLSNQILISSDKNIQFHRFITSEINGQPDNQIVDLSKEQKLNSDSLDTLLPSYKLFNNPLESSITIYPNPSSGLVTVTNPLTTKSYTLYDVSGKIMCKQDYFDQKNLTLDITTYQKGIYLLKIEDELGVQIQRLIKN